MELEYTWEILGTTAGAAAATLLIVQYIKEPLARLLRVNTRLLVLAVSAAILFAAWALGDYERAWSDVPLIVINAFYVALMAMGAYDTALKKENTTESERP